MSPTSRSKAKLEADGYLCAVVEKFVRFPPPGHRVDAFGFIDILCVRGDETLAVQATTDTGGQASKHFNKIVMLPTADFWLKSSTRRIVIHAWAKKGPRGKAKRWTCREIEIAHFDLPQNQRPQLVGVEEEGND